MHAASVSPLLFACLENEIENASDDQQSNQKNDAYDPEQYLHGHVLLI
jgi:hypothetical protein